MIDLHLHTAFSSDSDELPENYIKTAITRGETCLGFSEHYDYDVYLEHPENPDYLFDIDGFFKSCGGLSLKYPQIKILKGIELGFSENAVPHYKKILDKYDFDYSILSVHTVKGRGDCCYLEFFKGSDFKPLTKTQAYKTYLLAVLRSVQSDINYQIVGHIGYITRYAPYEDKCLACPEFSQIIDEILKTIIVRGACIEINTSVRGLSFDFLPEKAIINRYVELGGKNFTFGSDAHSAERYMQNADSVKQYLLSIGITELCRFEKLQLIKEKI